MGGGNAPQQDESIECMRATGSEELRRAARGFTSAVVNVGDCSEVEHGLVTSDADVPREQAGVQTITLSPGESQRLLHLLDEPFSPNRKLNDALELARQIHRRTT